MKAVISHRIYMDCTSDLQEQLDRELTYTIPTHNPLDPRKLLKTWGLFVMG